MTLNQDSSCYVKLAQGTSLTGVNVERFRMIEYLPTIQGFRCSKCNFGGRNQSELCSRHEKFQGTQCNGNGDCFEESCVQIVRIGGKLVGFGVIGKLLSGGEIIYMEGRDDDGNNDCQGKPYICNNVSNFTLFFHPLVDDDDIKKSILRSRQSSPDNYNTLRTWTCNDCTPGINFSSRNKLWDHTRAEHINSVTILSAPTASGDARQVLAQLNRDLNMKMFECKCGSRFRSTRNANYHRKCYEIRRIEGEDDDGNTDHQGKSQI